MKVNDNAFDKAIHDPIFLAAKIKRWKEEMQMLTTAQYKLAEQAELFLQDLALYRQDLLNSINTEEEKE